MKYLPTINVWDDGVATALRTGALKLQCGQWISTDGGRKARYVRTTAAGSIWALHFPDHCDYSRIRLLTK